MAISPVSQWGNALTEGILDPLGIVFSRLLQTESNDVGQLDLLGRKRNLQRSRSCFKALANVRLVCKLWRKICQEVITQHYLRQIHRGGEKIFPNLTHFFVYLDKMHTQNSGWSFGKCLISFANLRNLTISFMLKTQFKELIDFPELPNLTELKVRCSETSKKCLEILTSYHNLPTSISANTRLLTKKILPY